MLPALTKNTTPHVRIVLDVMHCRTHIGGMKRAKNAGDPKAAVAYLRVSTQEQDLGPEAQRAAIEAWAARQGVRVVSYFEDRLSGGTKVEDRPAMLEAFGALRAAGAGLLVAAKRDRIARDVVVAATVEQMARDAGARVVTADGVAVEDTPEGMLPRGLMDLFAQYERAVIRARTRAALAVKRSKGEQYTRRAPLGFRFEDGRLVEDPDERATLARVRDMKRRGISTGRVATILNAEGLRCRGGRWHVTTLARALRRAA
jgi:site-specific DNA recombinase